MEIYFKMKTKPNYQELEQLNQELRKEIAQRNEVELSLAVKTKALEKELDCFKLMDSYGQEGLAQKSIENLGDLTVEYFSKAFRQPHCLIVEYKAEERILELNAYCGFSDINLPPYISFSPNSSLPSEPFLLHNSAVLSEKFDCLNLAKAIVGPFYDDKGDLNGFLIGGQRAEEESFYEVPKICNCFKVMVNKTEILFQNFRRRDRLKKEIEDRRLVEQQLEAKTADLLRSNEDLQQFAYVASHDLKTPLRNITSFAQLLQRQYYEQLDGNGREYLEFISNNTKRFSNTIENLLQYSRLSQKEIKLEEVDFQELAENVKAQLGKEVEQKNATILYGNMPNVKGNKVQMEQLLQNLFTNALKFIPTNRSPLIEFNATVNGQYYIFEVKDNGIGIEEEYREKIFSLFQRLHSNREYEGTGLGLAICQKIVERHRGKIWVESPGKDQGASFFFALPK